MSKGLAQAETIEEIEGDTFGVRGFGLHGPGVCRCRLRGTDGFGEPLEHTPGEHRAPHLRCRDLRTWAWQHAARGSGPRRWEERFHSRHLHGGAEQFVECMRLRCRIGQVRAGARDGAGCGLAGLLEARGISVLGHLQKPFGPRPCIFQEVIAQPLDFMGSLRTQRARHTHGVGSPVGDVGEVPHQGGIKKRAQCVMDGL